MEVQIVLPYFFIKKCIEQKTEGIKMINQGK